MKSNQPMKPGTLVKYVYWKADQLIAPKVPYGITITVPDHTGGVQVQFGSERLYMWEGDLESLDPSRVGREVQE